jgi:hypothetical protein
MNFRGGEFSTGEMGNFHPALTESLILVMAVPFFAARLIVPAGVLGSI